MGVRERKRAQAAAEVAPRVIALPKVAPELLGELITVAEIVSTGAVSEATVRRAYREGELKGFIPAGREPSRAGRSGYRFRKGDVLAWLYGEKPEARDDEGA